MKPYYSPKNNPRVIIIQKLYGKFFNKDQAVERADKSKKNKGREAADAAIEILIGDN